MSALPDRTPRDASGRSLLEEARSGGDQELGHLLQQFRNYLLVVANSELTSDVRQKEAASDLVQMTLIEAGECFERFDGRSEEALRRWLKKILLHNVIDARRRYRGTAKRRLSQEVSLERDVPAAAIVSTDPTPSGAALQEEEACRLEAAIGRLSQTYQQVLRLRGRDSLSFREIGERMHRSPEAAGKLWMRAVAALKRELGLDNEQG